MTGTPLVSGDFAEGTMVVEEEEVEEDAAAFWQHCVLVALYNICLDDDACQEVWVHCTVCGNTLNPCASNVHTTTRVHMFDHSTMCTLLHVLTHIVSLYTGVSARWGCPAVARVFARVCAQ